MAKSYLFPTILLCTIATMEAAQYQATAEGSANPIRKVVTLLQNMVSKVEADGAKAKELYDKFMCYCQNSGGDLAKSMGEAQTKIPQLQSSIEAAVGKKAQFEKDIENHQNDRAAAKASMASATAMRAKENAAFNKVESDDKTNLAAVAKAIQAIDSGMGGSFLQTVSAQTLKAVVQAQSMLLDADRHELLAFLSGDQEYAPQSGEIVGILKTIHDEMSAHLKDAVAAEGAALKDYEALMAAKKKEVAILSKMLEEKLGRVADLGVKIAELKNDLEDTQEGLAEDQKFTANLEKNCKTKTAEHEANEKIQSEELLALADTIKVLNDDDALELFKKTLPTPASSLLEVRVSTEAMRTRALQLVEAMQSRKPAYQLDFISMALHGKKIGFDKVIKMIDDLVAQLKVEQVDDDKKKEYCSAQFDETDDKKKSLERSIADLNTVIAETKDDIATTTDEIASLEADIKALDKSVADATEQRKDEHAEYKEMMANDGAAKEVLGFAKNRLNKFYNPKLYKAPAKRDLSEEERVTVNMGGTLAPTAAPGGIAGTGITAFVQVSSKKDAPAPPPETAAAYQKKSGQNSGVIAMIDLLVQDLDKEMTEGTTTENDAQSDYESLMKNAAEKRTENTKSLADKNAAKADMQSTLETSSADKDSTSKELAGTLQYIHQLHGECDWLLKYFEVRKEARASEVDSLGKAKAVLSGADFSLLQTRVTKFLSH